MALMFRENYFYRTNSTADAFPGLSLNDFIWLLKRKLQFCLNWDVFLLIIKILIFETLLSHE